VARRKNRKSSLRHRLPLRPLTPLLLRLPPRLLTLLLRLPPRLLTLLLRQPPRLLTPLPLRLPPRPLKKRSNFLRAINRVASH
jgi:hypothetical protein